MTASPHRTPARARAVIAAVALGVLPLAACSEDPGVEDAAVAPPAIGQSAQPGAGEEGVSDPVAWAEAYCSGVTITRDAALAQLSVPRTDPAAQKQALGEFFTTAETAYQDSIRRLEELGAPTVDAGQRYHETALELYRSSLEAVQGQQRDLAALDPAAPDFNQRLTAIAGRAFDRTSVQERTDAISTDPQLAPALEQAQSCQEGRLGGGG